MKNNFPNISDMPSHTLDIVIREIERFSTVAYALEKERCSVYFIIDVLIRHLRIKNGVEQ